MLLFSVLWETLMREFACDFGDNSNLVGIYTKADPVAVKNNSVIELKGKPVVLLISSGLLPNTGPYRLYVRFARHLAGLGFDSFRFDLSGIGDSEKSTDSLPRAQQQIRDISVAMDYVESEFHKTTFVAMGICTGADNAHRAMLADDRIVGAVGIDGYYYKTPRYFTNYFFKQLPLRLLKRERWSNKLTEMKAVFQGFTLGRGKLNQQPVTVPYRWAVPDRKKTSADYQAFIERDVSKLCVFTASWPYNYLHQHSDAFPEIDFGGNIQVRYFENAEHVFPLIEERRLLTETVTEWLHERFDSANA